MSERNNDKRLPEQPLFRPSEYMRGRRPELFSDTPGLTTPRLEKGLLEYHLDTLTSRKQEQVFEEFCRRLAELEICPNLKPQTGPTGGGDSKVDASTYPVASTLAERCYWGSPNPPSQDAWAFAFSCKKKWRDKVTEDVAKVANLDRKFVKVFFISNQFIRDKPRAEMESELGKKHGFEVHVLDRSWIVTKVIEHKREDLAIDILGIRGAETNRPPLGPRDTSRRQELDALLKQLGRPELYHGNDYALAEDYLKAAKLARGLEKPRHEVDGLFARARTLSEKYGYKGQIIRCGYDHAWTSHWWFDDPASVEKIYSEIEGCLSGTVDAEDCALFSNLWALLYGAVKGGEIPAKKARLDRRSADLSTELTRLASARDRPNNALHAETVLYLHSLIKGIDDTSKAKQAFDGLKTCLKRSLGLGTYPAMQFIDNLSDMGEFLGDLPGYASLFDEMRSIARVRVGETSEGKLLYKRGLQLASKNRPKDALRHLGQARVKLAKQETLQESIRAGLGCCDTYMGMDLHWAARMEALMVAHATLRSVDTTKRFPIESLLATKRMGWLELSLGRIAPFIAWYELSWLVLGNLRSMHYDVKRHEEDLHLQDVILGCFFLNLSLEEVRGLASLQRGLDQVNLPMARWALLHALGEIDTLVKELPKELATNRVAMDQFFGKWKQQPASEQMPKKLAGETGSYSRYETGIMGVRYRVMAKNSLGPIAFAENLLGIIEAALALAPWENLAFIVDGVDVLVDVAECGEDPPPLCLDKVPHPHGYRFIWRPDMLEWLAKTSRREVTDYLMQFLLKLLLDVTIDPMDDLMKELERWHKEDTFSRALGVSPTSILLADLIGKERYEFGYWCNPSTAPAVRPAEGN